MRKKVVSKEMQRLLNRVGYTRAKQRYGRSARPGFPDLSTDDHRDRYKSGNCFAPTPGKRSVPADAKQFPVGMSHKQGPMLITRSDDLAYMGGKKS